MSSVIVLTPIVIGSVPVVASAIAAVAGSMGFSVLSSERGFARAKRETTAVPSVEMEVPNSELLDGDLAGEDQAIVIERGGVRIEFRRDARGACKVCATGAASKTELKRIAQEASGRLVQQFAYHKLMNELQQRGYSVAKESVAQDGSIQMRVQLTN